MEGVRRRESEASMSASVRPATGGDVDFLWEMLYEASDAAANGVPDVAELRRHPDLARYVEGWGARTDMGVVAYDDTGTPIGAAWLRLLTGDAKGYGYVDDETPEISIAVRPGSRGRGLGERMLRDLLDAAADRFASVSLSVRVDNPARRLYERLGFRAVGGGETGGSVTMTLATGRSPPRR
jgi:ribosomal protein S18 acetylase RimI-like enzyme